MNKLLVFDNEKLKLQVRTMNNLDGSISINAEDTAIGFGWYQNKHGKLYPKWERMNGFIKEFGFSPLVGKDDYIPESLFYLLGMKASNKVAQDFQKWLAIDVIPSVREHGIYSIGTREQEIITAMKAELTEIVDNIVARKINEIEEKCSEYIRPLSKRKQNICQYIKKRLGISKVDEEYELVKQRVLLTLGGDKWEDIPLEVLQESINLIDESIQVIKADRVVNQVSIFEMVCSK
jgi:hypothetical protein